MLEGKKILFVCPRHYDFPGIFIKELEEMGAEVIYFPDIEKELYFRFIKKIPILRNTFIGILNKRLIRLNRRHLFNYLLVIKGKIINKECLQTIRRDNEHIRLIMYQWDSIKNNDYHDLIPLFDHVASFDYLDVRNNKEISYLPLFYTREFEGWENNRFSRKIDLFFFGVFYEDRYRFLKNIETFARQHNMTYYFKLYISFFSLMVETMKSGRLLYKNLTLVPLSRKKISSIIKDSKCVIDLHHQNQTGLTMRTIEALGAGCKLITTNQNIRQEPFFSPSVISIIDRSDDTLDKEFITSTYEPVQFSDYSVKNFMKSLFSFENKSVVKQ